MPAMEELPIKPEPNSVVSTGIDVKLFEYFWVILTDNFTIINYISFFSELIHQLKELYRTIRRLSFSLQALYRDDQLFLPMFPHAIRYPRPTFECSPFFVVIVGDHVVLIPYIKLQIMLNEKILT